MNTVEKHCKKYAAIHDVFKSESVSGVIIGGSYIQAVLMYEDREQCQPLYVKNDLEAKEAASSLLLKIINDSGKAFNSIYPNDSWWVKII